MTCCHVLTKKYKCSYITQYIFLFDLTGNSTRIFSRVTRENAMYHADQYKTMYVEMVTAALNCYKS